MLEAPRAGADLHGIDPALSRGGVVGARGHVARPCADVDHAVCAGAAHVAVERAAVIQPVHASRKDRKHRKCKRSHRPHESKRRVLEARG